MRARDLSLWWMLWSVLLAAGWLIPNFSLPWPTFDRELLTACACFALAFGLLLTQRQQWVVPAEGLLFLLLIAVPVLQWAFGMLNFGGDAWCAMLYLGILALAIASSAMATRFARAVWPASLWFAFALAAIVSVALALSQWLDVELSDTWLNALRPGGRPYANIGQPNLLGGLCCLGVLAIWYAYTRQTIRGWIAFVAAAFLLFGIALTQSRAAWLQLAVFAGCAWMFRRQLGVCRHWKALAALVALFVVFTVALAVLAPQLPATESLSQRFQGGLRLRHWYSMVVALGERPITGWGWNQVGVAQQAVAPGLPSIPELIDRSHNIVLDILVWNGLPIGLLLIGLCAAWIVRTVRRVESADEALAALAIGGWLAYAMVEFPHTYLFTLLPAGFLVGVLSPTASVPFTAPVSRPMVAFVLVLGLCAMTLTATEYYEGKANFEALRFEIARVGPRRNSIPPTLMVLSQVEAIGTADRIPLSDHYAPETLDLLRRTSERYPAERLLIRYAQAEATTGNYAAAELALTKLCKLYESWHCVAAGKVWEKMTTDKYPFLSAVKPPTPEKP